MAGEFEVYKSVAVGGKSGRQTKQETREQIISRNSDQINPLTKFFNDSLAALRRGRAEV